MRKRVMVVAAALAMLSEGAYIGAAEKSEAATAMPAAGDPIGAAQYAWSLFVQAVRPVNVALTLETWTEQRQPNPAMAGCPSPAALAKGGRVLQGSALARRTRRLTPRIGATDNGVECNPMQTSPLNGYPPPTKVVKTTQFCEEVYVIQPETTFVKTNSLQTLTAQQTYANAHGGAITFPWDAVEEKADWVPTTSFANPSFNCPDSTNSLYTETINGTCYALVGLHISSKVLPDWLWATFEPASKVTNPNRCDPNLYDPCFDPWGTTTKAPYGKGQTVSPSPQLLQLMASAGLPKVFANYFLTSAQTEFVTSNGKPVPLGSSFVEFNAGVPPGQASCITCHKYAYFDGKPTSPENNFGGPPAGWAAVAYACNTNQNGNCTPVTPKSISQDFSWMLGLMPVR